MQEERERGGTLLQYAVVSAVLGAVALAALAAAPGAGEAVADGLDTATCVAVGGQDCEAREAVPPPEADTTPDPEAPEPEAALSIAITEGWGQPAAYWTLECSPPGGTHPEPEAACAVLAGKGGELPPPVPGGALCTMQTGGPQTAHISGVIDGRTVGAEFNLRGGCEIHRWDGMGAILDP